MVSFTGIAGTVSAIVLMALMSPPSAAAQCAELLDSVEPCTCAEDTLDCRDVSTGVDLLTIPGLQNGQSLNFRLIQIYGGRTIEEVPAGAFGSHSAEMYIFSKNPNLREISADAIATTGRENVKQIYVTENRQLTLFPFQAVLAYPNLQGLYVYDNGIQEIPEHALDGMSQSLSSVTLTGNGLTSVRSGAFMNLPALQDLRLQENQLTTLTTGSLQFGHRLDILYLMDNSIAVIEPGFTDFLPAYFNLERNQIKTVEQGTWETLLDGYLVDEIDATLSFAGNPMICDCQMKWLYDRKDFEPFIRTSVQCRNFGGTPLWSLQDSAFDGC